MAGAPHLPGPLEPPIKPLVITFFRSKRSPHEPWGWFIPYGLKTGVAGFLFMSPLNRDF
jgi:hypothetical protein